MRQALTDANLACHPTLVHYRGACSHLPACEFAALPGVTRVLSGGQDLFSQAEPCDEVFNLLEGWAFLYELLEDGRRQILRFVLSGDFLGFSPNGHASPFAAQALNRVRVCAISRARLVAQARRSADLALILASILNDEAQWAYLRLTSVGCKTALERISTLLLELFCRLYHHIPRAAGECLTIPLTQTHMADAVGLTSVHVNRTLGLLRHIGVIDYANGDFHILAPDRLVEIAAVDPQRFTSATNVAPFRPGAMPKQERGRVPNLAEGGEQWL